MAAVCLRHWSTSAPAATRPSNAAENCTGLADGRSSAAAVPAPPRSPVTAGPPPAARRPPPQRLPPPPCRRSHCAAVNVVQTPRQPRAAASATVPVWPLPPPPAAPPSAAAAAAGSCGRDVSAFRRSARLHRCHPDKGRAAPHADKCICPQARREGPAAPARSSCVFMRRTSCFMVAGL